MKRYTSAETFNNTTPSIATIGTFDGVHIGHSKIIANLVENAKKMGLQSVILTFFPHPRMVLQKDADIKLINTIDERIQILEKTGLNSLIVHPFTKEFSRLTAKEYVEDMLVKKLNVRHVIIGYDHRFGRNRNSDIVDLASFGIQHNFTVEKISKQDIEDVTISSTKIRQALHDGEIEKANKYLGYEFMLTGRIVKGKEIGRTLDFPTANLHIKEEYKLIPKEGVYIVKSCIDNKTYYGMMNIGTNPTVDGKKQTIETHFFDASFNLYEKKVQILLLKRIRDEKKFESIEILKNAMQQDEDTARDYINNLL
ncbi:bifunctional riboflavin kinase/FAD synthetase [Aquimarina sp. ERC-38]|uniref:bifunctional riboflavin kinase/FAD synthetase n=1 Tax=Aquimarina sp. ERC-38 TaxID=2949996 RepID=UPI00224844E3|nr:bifunctional riboflavin kinase/FAD synthetase [Aquimarina sp. ERC-38]UZO82638.1 bifunctional riboflavin kinase/FAD synthetase [Aquimarina sp. ERC-38]